MDKDAPVGLPKDLSAASSRKIGRDNFNVIIESRVKQNYSPNLFPTTEQVYEGLMSKSYQLQQHISLSVSRVAR